MYSKKGALTREKQGLWKAGSGGQLTLPLPLKFGTEVRKCI